MALQVVVTQKPEWASSANALELKVKTPHAIRCWVNVLIFDFVRAQVWQNFSVPVKGYFLLILFYGVLWCAENGNQSVSLSPLSLSFFPSPPFSSLSSLIFSYSPRPSFSLLLMVVFSNIPFHDPVMVRDLAGHFGKMMLISRPFQWNILKVCNDNIKTAFNSWRGRQAGTWETGIRCLFVSERSRHGALRGGLVRNELPFARN